VAELQVSCEAYTLGDCQDIASCWFCHISSGKLRSASGDFTNIHHHFLQSFDRYLSRNISGSFS
jgi:hypothetical protein